MSKKAWQVYDSIVYTAAVLGARLSDRLGELGMPLGDAAYFHLVPWAWEAEKEWNLAVRAWEGLSDDERERNASKCPGRLSDWIAEFGLKKLEEAKALREKNGDWSLYTYNHPGIRPRRSTRIAAAVSAALS